MADLIGHPVIPDPTGHLMPNIILISLHINAAGDGRKWMNATGWSCYTYTLEDQVIRTDYARNGDPDREENLFMDNKQDLI